MQSVIGTIRAKGGDVSVSVGGYGGTIHFESTDGQAAVMFATRGYAAAVRRMTGIWRSVLVA